MTDKLSEDGEFVISEQDSCALFDQLLDMIIGATWKVLDRVTGRCDYMLIVGGFGESSYLIEKMRQAFSGAVTHRIVSPDVPSQAVLKGKWHVLCDFLACTRPFLSCLCFIPSFAM